MEGGLAGQSWGRSPTCSLWCPQWTPGGWVGGQGLFSHCHASCSLTLAAQAGEPISGGRWGQLRTVLQELPSRLVSLGSSQGHLDTSASIGDPNLLSPSQPEKGHEAEEMLIPSEGLLGLVPFWSVGQVSCVTFVPMASTTVDQYAMCQDPCFLPDSSARS